MCVYKFDEEIIKLQNNFKKSIRNYEEDTKGEFDSEKMKRKFLGDTLNSKNTSFNSNESDNLMPSERSNS